MCITFNYSKYGNSSCYGDFKMQSKHPRVFFLDFLKKAALMSHNEDEDSSLPSSSAVISDLLRTVSVRGSLTLDLSRKGLNKLPKDFPICPKLEV